MALAAPDEPPVVEPLLAHLRDQLDARGLIYADEPEPVSGGFDNRILSMRLIGAPPETSVPLILRLGFLFDGGWQRLVDAGAIAYPGKPTAFRGPRQMSGIGRRFKEITGIS